MITREEKLTVFDIVKRADNDGILAVSRLTLSMDIENVHKETPLKLKELLHADTENFTHDIVGIQNNINRETGKLENCFLPRYAQ